MMAWESVERLMHPTDIAFNSAILVAIIGLIVNGASVFILGGNHHHGHGNDHGQRHDEKHSKVSHHEHHAHSHGHHHHDHNLRSAYLHVLADALTSVTAIIALLSAKYFGWIWMDPLMGIVGSILVAKWSIGLLKQTSRTLLDHQASDEIVDTVRQAIESDGHSRISDLHVWSIGIDQYGVILAVVSKTPLSPDAYRTRLDQDHFPHTTVEIADLKPS